MNGPLRILHLEDDPNDAELVKAALAAEGILPEIVRVSERDRFVEALQGPPFDVILADYHLPAFDGLSAQAIAREMQPATPFIFVSGTMGEEVAIERLKAGAVDYVLKQRLGRLPASVRRALAETAARTERRKVRREIRQLNVELEERVKARTAELAQANHDLESARRFLDLVIENIPAMLYVKDARALRLVRVNRAAENLLGYSRGELIGKNDSELFPPVQARSFMAKDREVLKAATPVEIPHEAISTRNGAVKVLHTRKIPLVDGDGQPEFLLGISEDITEQKKADDELKMARLEAEQANRAKSEFLSRMSHDLRTPLNAILGFAQLLELENLTEDQRESVLRIQRGGHHLLALINEVLDLARIEAGHLSVSLEPVSSSEVVERALELVQPLAAIRNIPLLIDQSLKTDSVVMADRERLSQVLLNLLSNAVKYNRPGGQVTVAVERIDKRLRIKVIDTGAGIPPAKLALLFQPFERLGAEQSEVEGTGLGLMLSRGLAAAMGGSLDVASEVDRGSTFWIELALSDAPASLPEPSAADPRSAQSTPETCGVVLYIEDNGSNVRLMERVIQRRPGVRLLHAPRGADGLRMAREAHPGLIFLDLHLPDMSGEEVLQQLWQDADLRRIPVAVLSADAMPAQTRRLKASGAMAYLTKPLEIRQVLRLVDEVLSPVGPAVEGRA
jgi:PAS domain S-box-containing protein